jgi:hypothetical protein
VRLWDGVARERTSSSQFEIVIRLEVDPKLGVVSEVASRVLVGIVVGGASTQFVQLVAVDVGLIQNTEQSAYRDFGLPAYDRSVDHRTLRAYELNMAALLALFYEPCRFKTVTSRKRNGLSRVQPRPRRFKGFALATSDVKTLR